MTWTLVKNLTAGLALTVAMVFGSGSALAQKHDTGNQITTFDPPGAGKKAGEGTYAQQSLNSGVIVGYYIDGTGVAGVAHGFIRSVDGKYTIIDVPELQGHKPTGSMTKGQLSGGIFNRLAWRMA